MKKIDRLKAARQEISDTIYLVLKLYQVMDEANDLLGIPPDSKFSTPIYAVVEHLLSIVSQKYGLGGWLDWYIHDNDFGKKGMSAGINTRKVKPIKEFKDFWRLIKADVKESLSIK
jgi:hypothetical protein